ncbi:MAG: hypothetical protein K0S49_4 [Microbacterium sp.]|nr:hypothetical protein [Microbacterium sp.]
MNPKGIVTEHDHELLAQARAQKAEADANWRRVVLEVAARSGSIRETAKAAGISPDTITEWKKQASA